MKWLATHITDQRWVVSTFAVLAVVNAHAMAYGFYR
jgi:hypothetical protein